MARGVAVGIFSHVSGVAYIILRLVSKEKQNCSISLLFHEKSGDSGRDIF